MIRPRPWRRRSRRAISDGSPVRSDRYGHRRLPEGARDQEPAQVPHLWIRGRRKVDPDRAAALRFQDDFRGPARGPRGGFPTGRDPGRGDRLRPAGRRPCGRAGAGHHHRCRLPLLLHRPPEVHRGRHPRARAVHTQHGHRGLHGGCGGDPDRRPPGRADPDPPPFLPRPFAGYPACRGGGEQDGPGRLVAGGLRPDRRRVSRLRRPDRA